MPQLQPHTTRGAAVLANGSVALQTRRETTHGACWRHLATDTATASLGSTSAGAATAANLLTAAVVPTTAVRNGRRWAEFEQFCADNDSPSLPTTPSAIAYFSGTLFERGMSTDSLQGILTPVNNRHVDAGHPKPAVERLIMNVRAGYHRYVANISYVSTLMPAPFPVTNPKHGFNCSEKVAQM